MKRSFLFILWVLFFVFPVFMAYGKLDRSGFISPRDLRPGMVGYGKTVFEGTKISTFKVVVLGVIPKFISGADLILVKVESPYLLKRGIGLVAGMSGSPVYFDGKLAGAVAYGWPFTKAAIAGVVPINAMLTTNLPEKAPNLAYGGTYHLGKAMSIEGKKVNTIVAQLPGEGNQENSESLPNSLSLVPLSGILAASGFNPSGFAALGKIFPMAEIVPGGGKMKIKDPPPVEPGQSVGVALMEGDMNLIATGTLTYRSGSRILAFGHPFLFLGNVDFPMVQTYVHYILPSMELPFKFASPIRPVGQIAQDRLYGIGGVLGKSASLVPINITVFDKERKVRKEFHVRIIRSPILTPRLATLAISQAIPAVTKLLGGATASVDYTIQFQGYPPIRKRNLLFSQASISAITTFDVLDPLQKILENNFKKVHLVKINVKVNVKPGIMAATIQKVVLDRHTIKPGGLLGIRVWLKPYDKKVVEKRFRIRIPADVQGIVQVGIAGGPANNLLKRNMSIPPPAPLNVKEMIQQVQEAPPFNSLIIRLSLPRGALNWKGESFSNFPSAYANLLKASGSGSLTLHSDSLKQVYRMPWVILGSTIKHVMIEVSPQPKLKQTPIPPVQPHPVFFDPADSLHPLFIDTSYSAAAPLVTNHKVIHNPQQTVTKRVLPPLPSLPTANSLIPSNLVTVSFDQLQNWQQGTLKNLAVSPKGDLFAAPAVKILGHFKENNLLSITGFKGAQYVGTADPGRIYKVANGKKVLFFNPKTMGVLSMASLSNGDLLAGTMNGRIFWLNSKGKIIHWYHLPEKYIWDIVPYRKKIYIAAGNPSGVVYELNLLAPSHPPVLLAKTEESHITAIYPEKHYLYAGTANNGLLLRIYPDGVVQTVADLNAQEILSLTGNSAGDLYIGVSGNGMIYCLSPDGSLRLLTQLPSQDITWLGERKGNLFAGTGIPARLYAVQSDGSVSLLWDGSPSHKSMPEIGLKGNKSGKDFIVSGNSSSLFHFSEKEFKKGVFLSQILDAGNGSLWGRLLWYGKTPPGSRILVKTRTGNTPFPDSTWSSWSSPYPSSGKTILSSGRYLQFKVSLFRDSEGRSPVMKGVQLFWKPENLPPVINVLLPKSGDVIDSKSLLRGTLQDAEGNTLLFEIWTERKGIEKKVYSNLFSTPVKGVTPFMIPLSFIHQNGILNLKILVSNSPSNLPGNILKKEMTIKNLTFDSTTPEVVLTKIYTRNQTLHLQGKAYDFGSYVKNIQVRMNEGPWFETVPENGIFDSKKERFYFNFSGIPVSTIKQIQVRASNAAGNQFTVTKQLKELLAKGG